MKTSLQRDSDFTMTSILYFSSWSYSKKWILRPYLQTFWSRSHPSIKRVEFWQISDMQVNCLIKCWHIECLKIVNRNMDDTGAEIVNIFWDDWVLRSLIKKKLTHQLSLSLFAKRFPTGRWSFLGLGSETKWYSANKERPGGKWDRVADLMMIKCGESGHPVSEQQVRSLEEHSKAKEVENYLYTSVPMAIRLKVFFAQSFLSISSVSTEQSQICVKNTVAVRQEQGDLLWQSNLTQFSRQQTYW